MKIYTFWSKKFNDVVVIVEEDITSAIKQLNAMQETKDHDYIIGSSIPCIKGYNCTTTII
jgi:hypothetical protein